MLKLQRDYQELQVCIHVYMSTHLLQSSMEYHGILYYVRAELSLSNTHTSHSMLHGVQDDFLNFL